MLIGAITMLARVIGFGRQVVFAHTVQAQCLGTAYTTANMVPNIIYDIVLGGALTAVVVPVLAGPARARAARPRAGAADLGGAAQLGRAAARPGQRGGRARRPAAGVGCCSARRPAARGRAMVALGTRMLVVFAPQILLYGLAVVLYGILQSHRRFAAPALAPVLSSLVVIGGLLRVRRAGGTDTRTCSARCPPRPGSCWPPGPPPGSRRWW